ncbi:hypothetical protein JCM16408A_32370 [Methylobacterium phyllosphaerae]
MVEMQVAEQQIDFPGQIGPVTLSEIVDARARVDDEHPLAAPHLDAGRAAAEFGVLRAADGRRAADAPEAEYEVLVGRQESRLGTVRHGDHESADSRSRSVMIETPSPFREGSFE